jgi:2-dehydro-3-deoxyglucarate aldolase/4-hydroxy-2-oxoheptanedioate aldolase
MNNSNLGRIKDKIARCEPVVGTIVQSSDPLVSEIMSICGFDFVWVDSEHGPIDKKDIDLHVMAIRGQGIAPFVRIPWNDPVLAKPVLEMGTAGIIVPFIKTAEDARLAVQSCRYPPIGTRGFGPRRAHMYSQTSIDQYLEMSETEPWVILLIEHVDGVNNLEEIVQVPGVDCILVGHDDLSASIGLLGKPKHPEVVKLLDRIAEVCRDGRIPFGGGGDHADTEWISAWIRRGASLVNVDSDVSNLIARGKKAYEATMKLFRESRG